jgi:toxin ParE1/3/4
LPPSSSKVVLHARSSDQPGAPPTVTDKPLAAREFAAAARDKVSALGDFPLLGRPGAYQDTRELVVHRNYIVTFRLRADEVQVVQVWHAARGKARGG